MNVSPFREAPLPKKHHSWTQPRVGDKPYRNHVYIQTKLALPHAHQAVRDLLYLSPGWTKVLKTGRKTILWEDGFVLSAVTLEKSNQLSQAMAEALRQLENWAILDSQGGSIEKVPFGPVGLRTNKDGEDSSQLFICFRPGERNAEKLLEQIRSRFKAACNPVFHFRDGKVLLLKSKEPSTIIIRRCERHLNDLSFFAGIDSEGKFWSAEGNCRYIPATSLQGIRLR